AGLSEPAAGRLISIPDRQAPTLNDLFLRKGRRPEPGRPGEVLVHEAFADAHKLQPGDRITAIINNRKQQLTAVGIALSPEYVFAIRAGEILPDDRRFGVFWMNDTELAAAFDLRGAFNDVSLALTPDASEPEVLRRLDALLAPYGGTGAYGRAEHTSHKFLSNEMMNLKNTASITPSIFLAVAAFLLHVVMSRLVQTQREQIAALKAFGYTRGEVGRHYLRFVLVLVVLGVALGTAVGALLGYWVTILYTQFFRFPIFRYNCDPAVVLLALGISLAAGVAGTLGAVR